ncbi:MAG: indolepyruvate ferredoxin oxidoreductase subunit alpha [Christensenellales bacterium]
MRELMLGNAAFARGAYEAGVTVATAYPGTPSTEITENIAKYDCVYAEWSPNEKVALEVALGASVAGARALCCMKHVGLNVAADPLFTAAYTGINGGLVIIVADDPGMHSSQNEQDSRLYALSAHLPMLEPADSAEAKEFVLRAYELSEQYDTPVIVRTNTRLSHSQGLVETAPRRDIALKPYVKDIQKYVMMPGMARKRRIVLEKRMREMETAADAIDINRINMKGAGIGVITSGVVYNYVREALPEASVLKLGLIHPLPEKLIKKFARRVDKLYVAEELEPFIERKIKEMGVPVTGKQIFPPWGEYSVNMIAEKIGGVKRDEYDFGALPQRPPVMCAGCPHRAVFYTIKKLGLTAAGDIGCYTLGALPPHTGIDTCVCMGASIGMAMGMEKARGEDFTRKLVAVIGDSTFFHSGLTGLTDMVYNGSRCTVIIVDNATTGMTGHQNHPATGKNLKGDIAYAIDIERLARALGVKHVRTVDPFDLKALENTLKEETARDELSVVIARRPCALLDKKTKLPQFVITDACKQCGVCLKLGCPAIKKTPRGITIDKAVCTGCALCENVCAFGAIETAEN